MSYDSDASFETSSPDFSGDFTDPPAVAPAPGSAASAALVAETAVAMAAASTADDFRADGGWDAPPPSTMSTSRAFTSDTAGATWTSDDDGPDDDWDDRAGDGTRPTTVSAQGQVLREVALRAYTLHPDACHQSTAEVAHHYRRSELDGQSANGQVATLRAGWREVNGAQAGALAARGVLVIAGLAGEGNAGHTAIVVAGRSVVIDNKVYPSVCGGGLPMRRSDGTRTAADTWTSRERGKVRYFTPDTRSWLRRAFARMFS